jgi:hypothetical protein
MLIEKDKKPKRRSRFKFEDMKRGDSFYYEGNRNDAIVAFGAYLVKGKYKTQKEGKGWRFHLQSKR